MDMIAFFGGLFSLASFGTALIFYATAQKYAHGEDALTQKAGPDEMALAFAAVFFLFGFVFFIATIYTMK